MTTEQLQEFFEKQDFNVHLYEQDGAQRAEVETWTEGGVNMIFDLSPFTKESFIERVKDFDIDEEIDFGGEEVIEAQVESDWQFDELDENLKDVVSFGMTHRSWDGKARIKLHEIVERVLAGEEIILTKYNLPKVKLVKVDEED